MYEMMSVRRPPKVRVFHTTLVVSVNEDAVGNVDRDQDMCGLFADGIITLFLSPLVGSEFQVWQLSPHDIAKLILVHCLTLELNLLIVRIIYFLE